MKDYEEITLLEEVESKQIKKDYATAKGLSIIGVVIIEAIYFGLTLDLSAENIPIHNIIFYILHSALVLLVLIGIAKAIIQPYKDLYNIALHNDMIRHDEKIKARERERVKTTTTPPPRPTRQNIKKTLDNIDTNINK